jgi:hypothetical protein
MPAPNSLEELRSSNTVNEVTIRIGGFGGFRFQVSGFRQLAGKATGRDWSRAASALPRFVSFTAKFVEIALSASEVPADGRRLSGTVFPEA